MSWVCLDSKSVLDFDEFYNDYSLWYNDETGEYVTFMGDLDIYTPDNVEIIDMEFDNLEEAQSWFDNYQGAAEDDIYSSQEVTASKWFYDHQPCDTYWYFTRHGVQPGSWPQGATVLDIVDTAGGTFVLTDKLLTTEALQWFDIKEQEPSGVTSATRVDPSSKVDVNRVFENVSLQLFADLKELISKFEDNLAIRLSSDVKNYNAEWCEEDAGTVSAQANKKIDNAIADIIDAELHVLFAQAPDSLTKL